MVGSLARRERRTLWGTSSFILAVGIGLALWMAFDARSAATADASADAEISAQTEFAPLLQPRDLMVPMSQERATQVSAAVERTITSRGPVQRVRMYSDEGRILYAQDRSIIGTRPSYLRDLAFEVSNGEPRTMVRNGLLQTYVPIWLNPGGTVVVAELSQPFEPIGAEATSDWYRIAFVAGGLLLICLVMVGMTTRAAAARPRTQAELYQPAIPRRGSSWVRTPALEAPMYEHPGFRALEEQRQEVERRARAAEENFRSTQEQLKATLKQMKDLEGRLAMNETQNSTSDGEIQVLRDQLRETSQRLHKSELDNNQMRERLALRHEELEEARRQVAMLLADGDIGSLRQALDAAEARANQLAREMEKLEGELDYTKSKFHMTKLSEALREFDNDSLEIEEDDLYEHPVVIRNSGISTTHKVR
jgi:hypothetical protein